jgi:UDP-N-acetylenolpyruvoylglucosamine reductase
MDMESSKPAQTTLSIMAIKPKSKKEVASPTRDKLAEAFEEIPQDIQNTMKDRQQEKAFEAGDAERKKSMGSMFKKGGKTASSRADGCAIRGKTRGKMV